MKGILYFSSTGNSLYLAKRIRERIPAHILYLPRYAGDGSEFDEVILVTPVYSFGLPVHSYDVLQRLCNDVPLAVVLTYGGATGGAERLVAELARRGNKNLRGVYAIQMPENYTLTFTTPKIYEKLVLRLAEKKIDRVIDAILRAELHLPAEGRTREALYEKNKSNWYLIGHDFSATEDCMQCGKCIAICPAAKKTVTSIQRFKKRRLERTFKNNEVLNERPPVSRRAFVVLSLEFVRVNNGIVVKDPFLHVDNVVGGLAAADDDL